MIFHFTTCVFVTIGKRWQSAGGIYNTSTHWSYGRCLQIRLNGTYWFWSAKQYRKVKKKHSKKIEKIILKLYHSSIFIDIKCWFYLTASTIPSQITLIKSNRKMLRVHSKTDTLYLYLNMMSGVRAHIVEYRFTISLCTFFNGVSIFNYNHIQRLAGNPFWIIDDVGRSSCSHTLYVCEGESVRVSNFVWAYFWISTYQMPIVHWPHGVVVYLSFVHVDFHLERLVMRFASCSQSAVTRNKRFKSKRHSIHHKSIEDLWLWSAYRMVVPVYVCAGVPFDGWPTMLTVDSSSS